MTRNDPDGATPLGPNESEGLLFSDITTRGELDRLEQENIAEGEERAFRRVRRDLLTVPFVKRLHQRMFGSDWKWAGQFRTTDKNIGIASWQITEELKKLVDDVSVWVANSTYSADEIAARFHHRLTVIHPFPNGNGRHARLLADLLLVQKLKKPRFTWGSGTVADPSELRKRYVVALRAADRHDYGPLLAFVRS